MVVLVHLTTVQQILTHSCTLETTKHCIVCRSVQTYQEQLPGDIDLLSHAYNYVLIILMEITQQEDQSVSHSVQTILLHFGHMMDLQTNLLCCVWKSALLPTSDKTMIELVLLPAPEKIPEFIIKLMLMMGLEGVCWYVPMILGLITSLEFVFTIQQTVVILVIIVMIVAALTAGQTTIITLVFINAMNLHSIISETTSLTNVQDDVPCFHTQTIKLELEYV